MLLPVPVPAVAAAAATFLPRWRAEAPGSIGSDGARRGVLVIRAAEPRFGHASLPRTNRHGAVVATLIAAAVLLPMGQGVAAGSPHEWAIAQRMILDNRSSALCYDRASLRAEGSAIRVEIRHHVADRIGANECGTSSGEAADGTVDTEILIRCGDPRWRDVLSANTSAMTKPSSGSEWRKAASGDYATLIDRTCAPGALAEDQGDAAGAVRAATSSAMRTPKFSQSGVSKSSRDESARAAAAAMSGSAWTSAQQRSSGTGFFVDGNGNALTNLHVVQNCREVMLVTADKRWQGRVVARDAALDLALIKGDKASPSYATFRANVAPRAGESVTAVGFPLRGLLASEPNVSTGIVNAVAGIRDDPSRFQISAPVQSGNSGGPVLDAGGNVIGVVVSKLDAMKVARETGDIPQNINFAIKGNVAHAFLTAHGILARTGTWTRPIDTIGVAAIAKAMTAAVECR